MDKFCLCSAFYFDPGDDGTPECPIHGATAAEATKECRRCGQVMPAESEPDGCRDRDCPEAK